MSMYEYKCNKHNVNMECLAGHNAHPSNWYCPECIKEEDATKSALDHQEGGEHYKKYAIQPTVFCHVNKIPSIESNVIKYVMRHRDKNGVKDIDKAIHYLNILKELEYGEEIT